MEKLGAKDIQSKFIELKLYFAQKLTPFNEALCLRH
jgi:hypothetical protein